MVWAFFVVFVSIIVLSLLFGCKTKTVTVTENVYVHDTVTSIKTDTVREVKVQTIRDTTIQKEVHTYTLNNVGDTVREIHHYHDRETVIVVDSTDRYKATVDSLRQALKEEKSKDKTIVKRYPIPWWLCLFFVVAMAALSVMVLKKTKFTDKI